MGEEGEEVGGSYPGRQNQHRDTASHPGGPVPPVYKTQESRSQEEHQFPGSTALKNNTHWPSGGSYSSGPGWVSWGLKVKAALQVATGLWSHLMAQLREGTPPGALWWWLAEPSSPGPGVQAGVLALSRPSVSPWAAYPSQCLCFFLCDTDIIVALAL